MPKHGGSRPYKPSHGYLRSDTASHFYKHNGEQQ